MTENRAVAVLRPWWDVAFSYCLYALIVVGKGLTFKIYSQPLKYNILVLLRRCLTSNKLWNLQKAVLLHVFQVTVNWGPSSSLIN